MFREMTAAATQVTPLEYYAQHGPITDPHEQAHWLNDLPTDIPSLVRTVQGVMIHIFWAERYGLNLSDERKEEVNLRFASRIIGRIMGLDEEPLTIARPLDKRIVGNCRDYSTLLCAILRHHGVPARARCGFGAYFMPNHFEDHWVCEYWNAAQQRWVMVDAQLDQLQCEVLNIPFDTLDVPRDQFITGGKAWQMCRTGGADPDRFGIAEWHGQWFVQDDLVRDFLALNKIEILPWDGWGLMAGPEQPVPAEDLALLDRIAALTLADNSAFDDLRSLYAADPRLHTAPDWLA